MYTLIISILPVFLILLYVYKKDKNKEPKKLLIKLFFGGFLSVIITLIISYLLGMIFPLIMVEDTDSLNLIELLIHVFIGVALIEEFSKWIISYKISYNNSEFDELYDMILYCTFVSLGFAFLENILYVSLGSFLTGLLRAVLAIPGHACDGILMGSYIGMAKEQDLLGNNKLKKKYLFLSILVPMIAHGIYDYCLYTKNLLFILLFFIFVIILYIISIKKVLKVSKENKTIISKVTCPYCGNEKKNDYCDGCGYKF